MRSCLCLIFFKKGRTGERRQRISHVITLITVPFICLSHLMFIYSLYLNKETGTGSEMSEVQMLMSCRSGVWSPRAHTPLTMVLYCKSLWAIQQSQKQTNSKIRTLHWSHLFGCLFPAPHARVWIPWRHKPCLSSSPLHSLTRPNSRPKEVNNYLSMG